MAHYQQTQPRNVEQAASAARSPSRGRRAATSTLRDKAAQWLTIAAMIAEQRVNASDIQKRLGIGRNTVTRYIGDLDATYGFQVAYVRPDGRSAGYYEILSWGVLDREKVCAAHGRQNEGDAN